MNVPPELMERLRAEGDQPEPLFEVKTCEVCGAPFSKPHGRAVKDFARQRFCSRSCASVNARRYLEPAARPSKTCQLCGAEFTKAPRRSMKDFNRQRFCSVLCSNRAEPRRQPPKPRASKKCEVCGGTFYKPRNRTRKEWEARRWCSVSCARRGRPLPRFCRVGVHEMSGDNVRIGPNGDRRCKACERDRLDRNRPTTVKPRRSKPQPQPAPKPVERPVWRPASFAPVPNTRRLA